MNLKSYYASYLHLCQKVIN